MRDYKANTFQMNNSIFQFGLTPIQFVVYSYLKYCAGNWLSKNDVKTPRNPLRCNGFRDCFFLILRGTRKTQNHFHILGVLFGCCFSAATAIYKLIPDNDKG